MKKKTQKREIKVDTCSEMPLNNLYIHFLRQTLVSVAELSDVICTSRLLLAGSKVQNGQSQTFLASEHMEVI